MQFSTQDLVIQSRLIKQAERLELAIHNEHFAAIEREQEFRSKALGELYTKALERTARRTDHYNRMLVDMRVHTTADVRAWVVDHLQGLNSLAAVDVYEVTKILVQRLDLWDADRNIPDWIYGCVARAIKQARQDKDQGDRDRAHRMNFFAERPLQHEDDGAVVFIA